MPAKDVFAVEEDIRTLTLFYASLQEFTQRDVIVRLITSLQARLKKHERAVANNVPSSDLCYFVFLF